MVSIYFETMKFISPILFILFFPSCNLSNPDTVFKDRSAPSLLFDGGENSFLEGPVVSPRGLLYFSLFSQNPHGEEASHIMEFDPQTSKVNECWTSQGILSGLAIDKDGSFLACDAKQGKITRISLSAGKEEVLASQYEDKPFDEPNDVVADPSGNVYFSDPIFVKEDTIYQKTRGVYRVDKAGKVELMVTNALNPNGVIFSPDQRTFYVADSPFDPDSSIQKGGAILAYQVQVDGELTFLHELVRFNGDGPDGMAVDSRGNIYVALFDGFKIVVFSKTGGKIDERLLPGIHPTNLAFGRGDKASTLYITTEHGLYAIKTSLNGFHPF